jgi:hypothetical protein
MTTRTSVARMLAGPEEWSRRKLQVFLVVTAVVVIAVVAGIAWSVIELLSVGAADNNTAGTSTTVDGSGVPPMSSMEGAEPGPLSTGSAGSINVPQPSTLGEAQVGTGFPESAEGALAQLIAIDKRAIESASVVTAQDVISAWAAPGGPSSDSWSGVAAVKTLLESAGLPANGATDLAIRLDPAMGLVRDAEMGRATVCVDFILSVTVGPSRPARIAAADCQHLAWAAGRWEIATGAEALPTPSLWPGTQASYDNGYQWLEVQP